ncbi:MAG: SulP family inorganic anion transporter [Chloroflexota bacterium]
MSVATSAAGAQGISPRRARIERWAPGVRVIRTYQRAWLPKDIIAGIVLVTLLVPQGMAYAEVAGLPAITGLYTTIVCLIAYAFVGPSPILVLGPDSALGPMIAATILPLAAGSESQAIALAGMLALLVGVVTVGAGLLKLGFVADLLSSPVRTGYLAGLAVVIFIGQLPKLFGFSTDADGLVQEAIAFLQNLDETNAWALGVGLGALATILLIGRFLPRVPGILVAVVGAIAVSMVLDLAAHGVKTIGVLPQGFPMPAIPAVPLSDIPILLGSALGISLVAIGDTISTSGAFASRGGYEVDGNQELVGIGSANLAAGLFSGFPVSTSGSRSAVARQSGAKSQVAGLTAAAAVLVLLVLLPGLVQAMPQPVLAAVVIAASISLFDLPELRRLWGLQRTEFWLALACGLSVALIGVLQGIIVAIVLSVAWVFKRAWQPYSATLGKVPGMRGWHDRSRHAAAESVPGLLILRWSAPLFFANANLFRAKVRELVAEATASPEGAPRWVLVAGEPITDIDTTAAEMLIDLDEELNAEGIHLAFAELPTAVRQWIKKAGVLEAVDAEHLYSTVHEGVDAYLAEYGLPDPFPD